MGSTIDANGSSGYCCAMLSGTDIDDWGAFSQWEIVLIIPSIEYDVPEGVVFKE